MSAINPSARFSILKWVDTHHKGIEVCPLVSTVYAAVALVFVKTSIALHSETTREAFIKNYSLTAINNTSVPRLIFTLIPVIGNIINAILQRREATRDPKSTTVKEDPKKKPDTDPNKGTGAPIKSLSKIEQETTPVAATIPGEPATQPKTNHLTEDSKEQPDTDPNKRTGAPIKSLSKIEQETTPVAATIPGELAPSPKPTIALIAIPPTTVDVNETAVKNALKMTKKFIDDLKKQGPFKLRCSSYLVLCSDFSEKSRDLPRSAEGLVPCSALPEDADPVLFSAGLDLLQLSLPTPKEASADLLLKQKMYALAAFALLAVSVNIQDAIFERAFLAKRTVTTLPRIILEHIADERGGYPLPDCPKNILDIIARFKTQKKASQ